MICKRKVPYFRTIRTLTYCDCRVIKRSTLHRVLQHYPRDRAVIEDIVVTGLDHLKDLGLLQSDRVKWYNLGGVATHNGDTADGILPKPPTGRRPSQMGQRPVPLTVWQASVAVGLPLSSGEPNLVERLTEPASTTRPTRTHELARACSLAVARSSEIDAAAWASDISVLDGVCGLAERVPEELPH